MLKIFTTQLLGVFRQIEEKNEEKLEDCARLLCQSILSDGTVYVHGTSGMTGLMEEATNGQNALPEVQRWDGQLLGGADAVLYCHHGDIPKEDAEWLERLEQEGTSIVMLTTGAAGEKSVLQDDTFHLATGPMHPLVPLEDGDKAGHPASLAGLFLYHALYLNVLDILQDY